MSMSIISIKIEMCYIVFEKLQPYVVSSMPSKITMLLKTYGDFVKTDNFMPLVRTPVISIMG